MDYLKIKILGVAMRKLSKNIFNFTAFFFSKVNFKNANKG